MLVMDNDSATNQPVGAVSFHTDEERGDASNAKTGTQW